MDDLQYLQSKASSTTIRAILDQTCDKALLDALDSLIQRARSSRRLHFRDPLSTDIAARLPVGGNVWNDIRLYCKRRLNDDLLSPFYLLECLLCIYQPVDTGAWIAPSILTRLEPHLLFDDDHL